MIDAKAKPGHALPDAYWLSGDDDLTLYVNGRARACVIPWLNYGEIHGPPRLLRRPKTESLVLPPSQVILDEIETRLALFSPAPVLDEHGRPVPGLRSQLAESARYYRDKLYLETGHPGRAVIRLLNEAHADLNKTASRNELSTAANEARFHCAEALRVLERGRPADQPYRFPRRAADAIRSAVSALDQDARRGTSVVLSFPFAVHAARIRCGKALEYVEKNERDRAVSRHAAGPGNDRPGEDAREIKKERSWTRVGDDRGWGRRREPPGDGDDRPPRQGRRSTRRYGHRR